jgi:uncharacterized protein
MAPLHTALYAGVLAIVFVLLSNRVALMRLRTGAKLGHGESDDDPLRRAVRVHGNFAEYVPFALVVIAIAELSGAHALGIHALGIGLVVARLLHAYGLSTQAGRSFGRFWGTVLTFAVLLLGGLYAAGLAVWHAVSG